MNKNFVKKSLIASAAVVFQNPLLLSSSKNLVFEFMTIYLLFGMFEVTGLSDSFILIAVVEGETLPF